MAHAHVIRRRAFCIPKLLVRMWRGRKRRGDLQSSTCCPISPRRMRRRRISQSCIRSGSRQQSNAGRSPWFYVCRRSASLNVCRTLGSILSRFARGCSPSRANRVFRFWPGTSISRQFSNTHARELLVRRGPLAEDRGHRYREYQQEEDVSPPSLPVRTNAGRIAPRVRSCRSSTLLFFPSLTVDTASLVDLYPDSFSSSSGLPPR